MEMDGDRDDGSLDEEVVRDTKETIFQMMESIRIISEGVLDVARGRERERESEVKVRDRERQREKIKGRRRKKARDSAPMVESASPLTRSGIAPVPPSRFHPRLGGSSGTAETTASSPLWMTGNRVYPSISISDFHHLHGRYLRERIGVELESNPTH
ncbi:hypothetical protein P168DRAFT_86619 [Aspergillus campestris IBT 28561]|uniref:Uncharacterized protein n=1 Tax=Aspergillus campestris (strain IBT 28561) TaxID=1392248 RepID=A0A2I1DAY8_ASPC2|nr:uncharacterized protein P168DRAFT_86619 [Aspergillus campestris IBT 28561]PKY07037.1 hypothetical protein P168DRAFT_86619 [Aspergillus campestris IBT 28561]